MGFEYRLKSEYFTYHLIATKAEYQTQLNFWQKKNNNETYFVPASLASSSLAMPLSLLVFLVDIFLPICWSALNLDQAKTDSTIPDLSNFLVKRSLNVHLDPNLLIWRVIISFVWESKVGLTTRQLTNNHKWFLIYNLKWKREHWLN